MSTAPKTTTRREHRVASDSRVSKVLEDRIAADGEQVAHTLEPDRNPDTVRYPDPEAPSGRDGTATTPQTNAEVQMARRTDAGPRTFATNPLPGSGAMLLLWGAAAAGAVLVIVTLFAVLL
jgi:hypothetical protein